MADNSTWQGRLPYNAIISLLDVNHRFNLAESTAQDLTFGDMTTMAGGASALSDLAFSFDGNHIAAFAVNLQAGFFAPNSAF